ncbi:MAG: ABC transporter ATP-binding protein [Alphaproteobacteria bacterium]
MINTINVKGVSKSYSKIQALKDIRFFAKKGEVIALLGPNGSGKTTLMNILAGVLTPDEGEIFILNKNLEYNKQFIKKHLGFLPEGSPLYGDMKVKDFLTYMAKLKNVDIAKIKKISKEVKIDNVLEQKIETLSKGYLRRVSFAQSLLADPEILLLDEPTDGLDPNQKEVIRDIIKKISAKKTIIISTHLLDDVKTIASKVLLINNGSIIIDGSVDEMLKQTNTKDIETAFKTLTKEY